MNPPQNVANFNLDAFSDGQVRSKIWLCEQLELVCAGLPPQKIAVLAGWYGMLPFLLFSRNRLNIHHIHLFDISAEAVNIAIKTNDVWRIDRRFEARLCDINQDKWNPSEYDLIINTSCEHFAENPWWQSIAPDTRVALQSTNMVHPEHVALDQSTEDLKKRYSGLSDIEFEGQLDFSYPGFTFSRYMVIGKKGERKNSVDS